MKELRYSNDKCLKKINDILVFDAIRRFNIKHPDKILLKGGKLYNLLTGDSSSFDIDVVYNIGSNDVSHLTYLREFFTDYFNKKFNSRNIIFNEQLNDSFHEKISIESIIDTVKTTDMKVLKFSYCYSYIEGYRRYIPFFEITLSNVILDNWEYSVGINCITPSHLLENLYDMANQPTFYKNEQCKTRFLIMMEKCYFKFHYNLEERFYREEREKKNKIPKNFFKTKSYDDLVEEGYCLSKIKDIETPIGSLEKYLLFKEGEMSYFYKINDNFIEIINEEENIESDFSVLKRDFERYWNYENTVLKINKITKNYLLETNILNLKYDKQNLKINYLSKSYVNFLKKKTLTDIFNLRNSIEKSPIIILTSFPKIKFLCENFLKKPIELDEIKETKEFVITSPYLKSKKTDGSDDVIITRDCLGLEPTLIIIFPRTPFKQNIVKTENIDMYCSRIKCLKNKKIYFKTLVDKKQVIEPMNLLIFDELP